MTKDEALAIVLEALENVNDGLPAEEQVEISPKTRLFGTGAVIDSLSLVSMVVDVEQAASDAAGFPISLTDDRAMNEEPSPFTDADTLSDYIVSVAAERS